MTHSNRRSQYWRQFGLQQIERELGQVEQRLQSSALSRLDRLFWQGRRRELRLAAWLVRGLITDASVMALTPEDPAPLTVQSPAPLVTTTTDRIFGLVTYGYRCTDNLTGQPLEIDILRLDKRQQLLQIICQQFLQTLQELQANNVTPEQLAVRLPGVLGDIWAASMTRFLGRYYLLTVADQTVEVVPTLLAEQDVIGAQTLARIPLTAELFGYLLWQQEISIDNRLQAYDTVPANEYVADLLANAVIQIANAIIQPFLNRFSDLEAVKQQFYHPDLLATRDIARFRNHLSWHYYLQEKYLQPTAIFESRHPLLVFRTGGIHSRSIYAPRRQELVRLQGIPWLVTMILEVRDAVAPPWRALSTFLGNVLVYVLTEIIGRGLGLVGRGILQGLGQVWQERR